MRKTMKKIIATVLTAAMAMSVGMPAFAADNTIATDEASIFQTEAFQDFQENGLPSLTLSDGEETCITYEDGSAIMIGVVQESSPCINNGGEQILRDPSGIMYNGKTIVYADFYNDIAGKREFRVNLEANYQYGSYKIIMNNANISLSHIPAYTEITNNSSYATYCVDPDYIATVRGTVNVSYNDTLDGTSFTINNSASNLYFTLICGPYTITVETDNNISRER